MSIESWASAHDAVLDFIEPGKPAQDGYIERFNRIYSEDVLDLFLLSNLTEARVISELLLEEYNAIRPHDSLNGLAPYQHTAVNVR